MNGSLPSPLRKKIQYYTHVGNRKLPSNCCISFKKSKPYRFLYLLNRVDRSVRQKWFLKWKHYKSTYEETDNFSLTPAAARWLCICTSLRASCDVTVLPPLATNTFFAGRCLSDPESDAPGPILNSGEVRGPLGHLQPLALRHGGSCRCLKCSKPWGQGFHPPSHPAPHYFHRLFFQEDSQFCTRKVFVRVCMWPFFPGNSDIQWCFSQVKGTLDDDVTEGE